MPDYNPVVVFRGSGGGLAAVIGAAVVVGLAGAGPSTAVIPVPTKIYVSLEPDRSSPRLLRARRIVGPIYVFAGANPNVRRVRYFLDDPEMAGRPAAVRSKVPFDLRGLTARGEARPFDTTRLENGLHTITAAVEFHTGVERVLRARFSVPRLFLSPTGVDSNACGLETPCLTLGRAYERAAPGQVVEAAPGDYPVQRLVGDKEAPGVVFDLDGARVPWLEVYASNAEFRSGRIDHWRWDSSGPAPPSGVTFRNVQTGSFHMNGGSNISVIGGELGPNGCASTGYANINWVFSDGASPIRDVLLSGVTVHDNRTCLPGEHYEAIRIDRSAVGITIRNSRFERNEIFHVFITDSGFSEATVPRDITIENNTFDRPIYGGYAIKTQEPSVQTCTNYTIRNNRFANTGAVALTCPNKVNVVVARNTVG